MDLRGPTSGRPAQPPSYRLSTVNLLERRVMRVTLHPPDTGDRRSGREGARGVQGIPDQSPSKAPIEARTGIALASRRDVAMAHQPRRGEARIGPQQNRDAVGKCAVLRELVRVSVGALELDADREIVAGFAPLIARAARMPGAVVKAHVLGERPVAADAQMRGDSEHRNLGKVGMYLRWELVGEKPVDPGSPELTGRQADAVHDDELGLDPRRSGIEVGGRHAPHPLHPSTLETRLHHTPSEQAAWLAYATIHPACMRPRSDAPDPRVSPGSARAGEPRRASPPDRRAPRTGVARAPGR